MEILENQINTLRSFGFEVSLPLGDRFDSVLVGISYKDILTCQDYVTYDKSLNIRKYEDLMLLIRTCEIEFDQFKVSDGPIQLPFFVRDNEVHVNSKFDFRGKRHLLKVYNFDVKTYISNISKYENSSFFKFYVKNIKINFINFSNTKLFYFPFCVSKIKHKNVMYNVIVLYNNSSRIFDCKSSYYFVDDFGNFCDSPESIFDKLSLIEDIVWRD